MTSILVDEDLRNNLTKENRILRENNNQWFYVKPFWYRKNEYGTVHIFDQKEIIGLVSDQYDKNLINNILDGKRRV